MGVSLCRRHPLRMRSTPGVAMDPARIFYFILFFFFGGGAKYDCGRMCVRRASGLLHIAMPTYHLLKTIYGGS